MVTGKDVMEKAGILLNDEQHVRWTLPELCLWINDGVRAVVMAKPSASSKTVILSLVEGTLQRLPTDLTPKAFALLRIIRNLKTTAESPREGGRIIRMTDQAALDVEVPGWHDGATVTFKKEVRQATFDPEVPLEYYVYPGNDGTGIIEAAVSTIPIALTASGNVDVLGSYISDIGLPEPWSPPVIDYVLYRAQMKDDTAGSGGRAMTHYQQFATAVGLKVQVERSSNPNTK